MNHRNHQKTEAQIAAATVHRDINRELQRITDLQTIRQRMRAAKVARRKAAIQETIDRLGGKR